MANRKESPGNEQCRIYSVADIAYNKLNYFCYLRMINHVTVILCFTNKESRVRKMTCVLSKRGCIAFICCMYLCLMVTNCTGERSFSKLRRFRILENAQRMTIGQGRLNMLTLMSIESELLRTIDVNSIIDDFTRLKAQCDVNSSTPLH